MIDIKTILFLMVANWTFGQVPDSLETAPRDTTTISENTFFSLFEGKPGKAALYGLVVPGGGQIYNRDWWKLPLVYGLEGFLIYRIIQSSYLYNGFQDAYITNLTGGNASFKGISNVQALKNNRDKFRKQREFAYIYFIGGHLLTVFEAFVDRHMMDFDVSENLSFDIIPTDFGPIPGITVVIPLN